MVISRRRFVTGAAAAVGWAVTARRGIAAPPIVQPEITPQQFGATGNAATDTAAWNRAVAEASRLGRPVVASGTYILRAPAASRWNWSRRTSSSTHVAVELRSHTHVFSKGCTILVGRPEAAPSSKYERHLLFGTNENAGPGTLKDIQFEGLTFDFREEFGPVHGYTYAVAVIGVDDFQRRNLTICSTGTMAGRGLMSENTRRRTDTDIKHNNIIQGIYTRYETGVAMKQISFDRFVEALDFDGPCWNVELQNLEFKNGVGEAQCIDTGGGDRWSITTVRATNVGPVLTIYTKANAWPTYEEWLNSGDQNTDRPVAPSNFVARDVRAWNAAGSRKGGVQRLGETLRVGNTRNEHSRKRHGSVPGPRDITIENWVLENSAPIVVNDCDNLTMRQISILTPVTPDNVDVGAAIVLREPEISYGGRITGTVSDVTIRGARGMGINAVAGNGLSLDAITIDGYNLSRSSQTNAGIRLRARPGRTDTPRLGATTIQGGTRHDIDRPQP